MPLVDPMSFVRSLMQTKGKHLDDLVKTELGEVEDYLSRFLGQQLMHHNMFFKFHPDNCRRTLLSPVRNLIGIAPQESKVAQALAKDLQIFCKLQPVFTLN
jgi:hypothetical protein